MTPCTKCASCGGVYIDFDQGQAYASGTVTALPRWGAREAVIASEACLALPLSHHATADGGKHPRLHPIEAAVRVPQWAVGSKSLGDINKQFQQVVWRIREAIKPYGHSCVKVAPRAMPVVIRPVADEWASRVILSPRLAWDILGMAQEAFAAGKHQESYEAARHSLEHYGLCLQTHLLIALVAMTHKVTLTQSDAVRSACFLRLYHKGMRMVMESMPSYRLLSRKTTHKIDIDRYVEILRNHENSMEAVLSWADDILGKV